MNDFSEIESELKKLRPAPVSNDLIARVEKRFLEGSSIPRRSPNIRRAEIGSRWGSVWVSRPQPVF